MTKDKKSHKDWEFVKKQCLDCYELNKDRIIQTRWKSFSVKACPEHQKIVDEIWESLKMKRLLH